jgi:GTP:adenosylcobinamide-phosphate guanylyltransferase
MAGRGSRFEEQGYTDKKPFIDVNGKPMVHRVIENLDMEFDTDYKFIMRTLTNTILQNLKKLSDIILMMS